MCSEKELKGKCLLPVDEQKYLKKISNYMRNDKRLSTKTPIIKDTKDLLIKSVNKVIH